MPCQYTVVQGGNVVLEKWTGAVTLTDLIAHKQQLLQNPEINAGASVLSDCTNATFEIPRDGIGKLAEMEGDAESGSTVRRYAFLVAGDLYEKARLFADQAASRGKRVIIFNSLDLACTWLGMDFAEVQVILSRV